jgi:hypothetical protein
MAFCQKRARRTHKQAISIMIRGYDGMGEKTEEE